MTIRELTDIINIEISKLNNLDDSWFKEFDTLMDTEIVVYFDFPLMGAAERYKITEFTLKDGFMLYNPTCNRPTGH